MIKTADLFDKAAAEASEQIIFTHDKYLEMNLNYPDGFVYVQAARHDDKPQDVILVTTYIDLAEDISDEEASNIDFIQANNRANFELTTVMKCSNGKLTNFLPLVVSSYDDTRWLETMAMYYRGSLATQRTLSELEKDVWPILHKTFADVTLVEVQRTSDLVAWRYPVNDIELYFFIDARDYKGCPFFGIRVVVPEEFYYNHALARTWPQYTSAYQYDFQSTHAEAVIATDRMSQDSEFRLRVADDFNKTHALPNLGIRMYVLESSPSTQAEQRIPLFLPFRKESLVLHFDAMLRAYGRRFDSPQIEDSKARQILGGISAAKHVWDVGRFILGR